jgi:hypothetical protein
MKRTLAKPLALPRLGLSRLKVFFTARNPKPKKETFDSIFSLACQRCAGFTTRPAERKEQDY